MLEIQVEPSIAELAPTDEILTVYDVKLKKVYLRILDAMAASADWRTVAREVLLLDPDKYPSRQDELGQVLCSAKSG